MLRPAGGGIYTVSSGTSAQKSLQRRIYRADRDEDAGGRWREALSRLPDARVIVLGVPSDVGAGFMRGAMFGPQAIREELLRRRSPLLDDPAVVDAGDVLCVPQLLDDEMLSAEQIARTRIAMYGEAVAAERAWPVSPLSIAREALDLFREIAPSAAPLLLGGDHSVGWPGLASVARGRERETGILHFDAHTDLLSERLGVRYCFATWAHHANELVGRGGRLVQVGLRISRHPRTHWESELGVRQYWMDEVERRSADEIAGEIVESLHRAGVRGVYVSNDIDGTDPAYGGATGTPEPGGLSPGFVLELIGRVAEAFPIWGSDLVEVAPNVGEHSRSTLDTAARYAEAQVSAVLDRKTSDRTVG
jgi:agmatinase